MTLAPRRLVLGAALIAGGLLLLHHHSEVRVAEAAMSRPVLAVLLGEAVHVGGTDLVFYPNYAAPGLRALKVTLSCSSVLLVGPMLIMGGAMSLVRRFSPLRAAWAMVAAATLVFTVNLLRIAVIAVATRHLGRDGYELSHRIIGSGIVLVAAAVAFMLAYRIVAAYADRGGDAS
jgi:exosortase/archaeosortase family protein